MRKISIGFSRPKGHKFPIFSWLVQLMEGTEYSHVYVRWHSQYLEKDLVYEASGTMVHFTEGSRFDRKAETLHVYELQIEEEQYKRLVQRAMDYCGAPYGLKQVFGIAWVKLARVFGKDIKNPFSDGKATWICSELVNDLLMDLGMCTGISADNVTPRDIQEYLSKFNS